MMNIPMSDHVAHYIVAQKTLGYRYDHNESVLKSFARFAQARGEYFVRSQSAIKWATRTRSASQPLQARKLRIVCAFAKWMNVNDSRHQIPPHDVLGPSTFPRRPPHLISIGNIHRLLDAALGLGPTGTIAPVTWYHLIGLVATTGMRISEALALTLDDFTSDGLIIRNSKFGKSRLIALHSSTWETLSRYLQVRCKEPTSDRHLFVIATGRPPSVRYAHSTFRALAEKIGIRKIGASRGPTFHSMRHGFAIRSLQALESEADASRHMLALATYLGHAQVSNTYWYLQATPELLSGIAQTTEQTHRDQCGGDHD